jgi:hypothetical protein
MGEVTISVTKTTTHSSSRSSTCPAARRCDIGLIVWIFTLIAGALCVFGGVLAICDTDFGRAWILFFFQCMFGLIILGNEIPVLFLLKHMPTLSSYEFKGFFLIFVATFMFGGGGTWRDNSTWAGWLVDFCGVVLVVKGAICILLWLGKETCCTKCLGNEIEHVAGAIHVQHTVLHEQSVIVTTNDHIAKCPSWCTVACTIQVRKTPCRPRSWANFSLYSCITTGMHGPTCIFWASLTSFSLQCFTGLAALLVILRSAPQAVSRNVRLGPVISLSLV